jgi:hypothetical protein
LPSKPPPTIQQQQQAQSNQKSPSPLTSPRSDTHTATVEINKSNPTNNSQSQSSYHVQHSQKENQNSNPIEQNPLVKQTQPTNTHGENIHERDTIIANDIETDKLLNAIEKSKGFSDSFSTTRRMRHRQNMLNGSLYYANDRVRIRSDNLL